MINATVLINVAVVYEAIVLQSSSAAPERMALMLPPVVATMIRYQLMFRIKDRRNRMFPLIQAMEKKKKESSSRSHRKCGSQNLQLYSTSSTTMAASPPLLVPGAGPLVLAAVSPPAALGSKYSLISASSSSTLFGLGRPTRPPRLPRPCPRVLAESFAPPDALGAAAAVFGVALALALGASFFG